MSDNLKAFMAESAIKYKEVDYIASERFIDEKVILYHGKLKF